MEIYFAGPKKVFADINGFTIKTDQHAQSGGEGEFPEPFTFFLASLGTCAGIYVKSFCDRRGISTKNIKLKQKQQLNPMKGIIDRIQIDIKVPNDFPDKYDKALIHTASLCAVKKHLKEDIRVDINITREN